MQINATFTEEQVKSSTEPLTLANYKNCCQEKPWDFMVTLHVKPWQWEVFKNALNLN